MAYLDNNTGGGAAYLNGQQGESDRRNILSTVDLFSGSVKLPLLLGTMEGKDDLSVTLQANYVQRTPQDFYRQNRKSAGSVLGYAWNMDMPAIVSANMRVRQNYQRDFYLIGNGGRFPLYRVGRDGDRVAFISVEHPVWKFFYYDTQEVSYWEVWHEEGSVWKYGGTSDSNMQALCWDNWIGPSIETGAESFVNGWYLSGITGAMGVEVKYEYQNVLEPLGGNHYTRTMRLIKITSTYGESVCLNYLPKEKTEYGCSHTGCGEENAWQEKYEDQYLDSVDFYNNKGVLLYSQKFEYVLKPSLAGEEQRLLVSLTQVQANGEKLPKLAIAYAEEENREGILNRIEYPLATQVEYCYENKTLQNSDGMRTVDLDAEWESRIYTGQDFYLCVYTRDTEIRAIIHEWDMGWKQTEIASMEDVRADDVKVFTGSDYVCFSYLDVLDNNYKLKTVKRCPVRRFDWETGDWLMENSADRPAMACGKDFIAFMGGHQNMLTVLQYKYTDNCWHENHISVDSRDFQALGAGDGFLFGAYGDKENSMVRFISFYSDEEHNWQIGEELSVSVNVDWELMEDGMVWAIGDGQAAACFVVLKNNEIKTTLVLLAWTDNYRLNNYEVHNYTYGTGIEAPLVYAVASGSVIGYGENVFRYEPRGWIHEQICAVQDNCSYRYSYANDIALGTEKSDGTQRFYALKYNPYTGQWEREGAPSAEDLYQYEGICQPLAVDEYAVLGRNIFTRNTDGEWECIEMLEEGADFENVQIEPSGEYLLYERKDQNQLVQVPLINNAVGADMHVYDGLCLDSERAAGFQAGSMAFYAFGTQDSDNEFKLYRIAEHEYKEKQDVLVVTETSCFDGNGRQSFFMQYDLDNARYENKSPAMPKTTVSLAKEDGSFGKIEYEYFNGTSAEEFDYPEDEWTNVREFYSHMQGQLASSCEYDGDGNRTFAYKSWYKAMDHMGFCICQTRMQEIRYLQAYDIEKGEASEGRSALEKNLYIEYEDEYCLRRRVTHAGVDGYGEKKSISTELHYAWEDNAKMLAAYRLTDIAKTVKTEDNTGQTLEMNRYNYACAPNGRYYQESREVYDATWEEPWVCESGIVSVNSVGDKLCEKDIEGIETSYVYDCAQQFVTAVFENAAADEVLYCGFEEYEGTAGISVQGGTLEDCIVTGSAFSGERYVKLPAKQALTLSVQANSEGELISFAARSKGKIYLSWNGETCELSSGTDDWKRLHATLACNEGQTTAEASIYGDEVLQVDAVFLSPLHALGTAYVYSGDFMQQTAVHYNAGIGSGAWYDRLENKVVEYSDDGTPVLLTRVSHGRQNAAEGEFVPDEFLSVTMPKGGFVSFKGGQSHAASAWWSHTGNTWTFQAAENYVLFWAAGESAKDFSVTIGDFLFDKSENEWNIMWQQEKAAGGTIDYEDYFVLIKVGGRLQLSCGEQILYTGIQEGIAGAAEAVLNWGDDSEPELLGFAKEPKITLSYMDYAGKPLQDIAVTRDGIIVGGTVYNELGQGEIMTRKAALENELWTWRSRFVEEYDWNTGEMTGEISEIYPEDTGCAYQQVRCTRAPQPKPYLVGQAGKERNISAEGSVTKYEYYVNDKAFHGIGEKTCLLKLQTAPDGGRIIEAVDAFENTVLNVTGCKAGGEWIQITESSYDASGNCTEVRYPNAFADDADAGKASGAFKSRYIYDGRGRMTMQQEQDSSEIRFIYDKTGKLRYKYVSARGDEYIYYVYDKYGRRTEEGRVNGSFDEEALRKTANERNVSPENAVASAKYFYDGDGTDIRRLGKLYRTESYDENGALTACEELWYDDLGNMVCKKTDTGEHSETVRIAYDEDRNVTSYTIDDETLSYRYDIQSRLSAITYGDRCIYECEYFAEGNIREEVIRADNDDEIHRTYVYDSAMWLTEVSDTFFSQELTYDDSGKIIKCKGGMSGAEDVWQYMYDDAGRLSAYEKNGKSFDIVVDANGNQISSAGCTYEYEEGKNQLQKADGRQFEYDAVGNVIKTSSDISLTYDKVSNRLISIQMGDDCTEYIYGGEDNISVRHGDKTTWLIYDMQGRILCERRDDGTKVWCIYGVNGAAAQIMDGKLYYMIRDYQSGIRGIYGDKHIMAAFAYDIKGCIEQETIDDETVKQLIPLRFAGARYENGYGLYRMRHRVYDPVIGRFFNMDTENQHTSPYIYGGADWVNYFDPDGASSVGWSILGIIAGVLCVCAGAALTIATAGMGTGLGVALGFAGAGLVGAGIGAATYGITSAISGDFNAADFFIYMGMGFVSGAVGAGIGAGISSIAPTIGAVASGLVDVGTGIVVGGADAFLSNGFINLNHGNDFCDNWELNVGIGCAVGGLMGAFSGLSSALRNNRAFIGRTPDNTIGIENYYIGRKGHLHVTYRRNGGAKRYSEYTYVNWERAGVNTQRQPHNPNHLRIGEHEFSVNNRTAANFAGNSRRTIQRYNASGVLKQDIVGPNCTTYVIDRLAGGGINVPIWMRSPSLLYQWGWLVGRLQ